MRDPSQTRSERLIKNGRRGSAPIPSRLRPAVGPVRPLLYEDGIERRRMAVKRDEDPTAWFERLYAEADIGTALVPWERSGPRLLLVQWAEAGGLDGRG